MTVCEIRQSKIGKRFAVSVKLIVSIGLEIFSQRFVETDIIFQKVFKSSYLERFKFKLSLNCLA